MEIVIGRTNAMTILSGTSSVALCASTSALTSDVHVGTSDFLAKSRLSFCISAFALRTGMARAKGAEATRRVLSVSEKSELVTPGLVAAECSTAEFDVDCSRAIVPQVSVRRDRPPCHTLTARGN
jgi:hypothetical protein